jgi:hypothetical protein
MTDEATFWRMEALRASMRETSLENARGAAVMIGNGYWATGIIVRYGYSGEDKYGWGAEVNFYDDGFCDDDTDNGVVSTQGTLHTRYLVREGDGPDADALAAAIDAVKAAAERLGIQWRADLGFGPNVYYQSDGQSEDYPPPDGWRELIDAQAQRIGWPILYTDSSRA